jgi:hypothetical protein
MTIATFFPVDVLCSTARRRASGEPGLHRLQTQANAPRAAQVKKPLPHRAIKSTQDAVYGDQRRRTRR